MFRSIGGGKFEKLYKELLNVLPGLLNGLVTLQSTCQRPILQKLLIEFNEYVRHPDKLFVSSCVLAIGKIASALPEATGSCLFGLMALMSHPATPPNVVADSVVVMRRIMQQNKKEDIKNEKIWIDTLNTWKIEKIKREEERIATKLLEGEAVQDGEEVEEEDSPSSESESSSEEEDEGGKELSAKKKKKRAKKKAKKVAKKLKKKQKKAKKKAKKAKKKSKKLVEEDDESKYPRPVRNDPVVRVIHKLWQTTVPTARASIIWMIAEFQFKNEIKNFMVLDKNALKNNLVAYVVNANLKLTHFGLKAPI